MDIEHGEMVRLTTFIVNDYSRLFYEFAESTRPVEQVGRFLPPRKTSRDCHRVTRHAEAGAGQGLENSLMQMKELIGTFGAAKTLSRKIVN